MRAPGSFGRSTPRPRKHGLDDRQRKGDFRFLTPLNPSSLPSPARASAAPELLPSSSGADVTRLDDLFSAALALPTGERAAFVAAAGGADETIQAELEALLGAHETAGAFMGVMGDEAPSGPPELARFQPRQEADRIGRYQLLEEIGEGGFGTVWLAEQLEPISRRVALKIIKAGMDTREVIARFESERQALAMMDDPNIATVFDAGATPLGRPYFVMELVQGVPITQYCDDAGLGTRERLALFGDVCRAINHAHQKGVIHRDIKPSNIMVTLHGDKPVVKVIDFGIAKATQGKLTDKTLFTRFEQFIGTPVYMSPEQAAVSGLDVDTRSDIYALGILLYELLTGQPPFDAQTMASAGPDELRRIICEVEPPKPSARLRTTAGELARARQIPATGVGRLVEPDLDWIVMKAIEKDRARRYQTANAFAQDIEHFLADEPVSARAPSPAYLFRKFARRHRLALRVAACLVSVLVAATVVSTWQAVRATRAEQRAQSEAARATQQTALAEGNLAQAQAAERESTAQRLRADGEAEAAAQNLYYAQMHLGQQAWREHRGLKTLLTLLAAWVPAAGAPDRRGWEWSHLHALPSRNLRTLTPGGSSLGLCTVAWHGSSRRLAEGTASGLIRIWDVDQAQTTLVLQAPAPGIDFWGGRWLAWNPDGTRLAAGARDGTVRVWETRSGEEIRTFPARRTPVCGVAFSSDGTRLAAWETGGTITLWEAETGRLAAEIVHPAAITAAAWSPDDQVLAAGHADGTTTFSGTRPGDPIVSLPTHPYLVYDLAWSPDSTRIATTGANDFLVSIWHVASRQKVVGPLRHSHGITTIAWEPDGRRLATGSYDETVKIWEAATGRELVTLRGQAITVTSVAWGPHGGLASGGADGSLKIWDSLHDQESTQLAGNGRRATALSWSPDGKRLASAGDDGVVRIWNPAARRQVLAIPAHDEGRIDPQYGLIRSLTWSPEGTRVASAGLDGAVKVWDAQMGRLVLALPAEHGAVWAVAWSPDGNSLAAGAEDGTISLAENLASTPAVRWFRAHPSSGEASTQRGVRALAWSPRGDRLASAGWDDRLVKLWEPRQWTELARLEGHTRTVTSVSWSPDGQRLATASADFLVLTWDAATGQRLQTLRGHNDFADAVRWSPDGSRLASAGIDNSVRIWDPRTGQETFVLRGASGMFHDVAWHPAGTQVAAASSDGQIWIWDATAPADER